MNRPGRDSSRYEDLRSSGRALVRVAPWVRLGLVSVGFSMFLDQARSLVSDAQFTWGERRIMGIVGLGYLGGFGLAAWVVGRLLTTSSGLIDVLIDQAEAAGRTVDLIERQAIPSLGRIALALENLAVVAPGAAPVPTPADDRARAAELARRAIGDGRWAAADRLVGAFVRDHPGPDAAGLLSELDRARRGAVDGLRARVDAAQAAGQAAEVVDLRDELTQHLRGADLDDLDRRLARWLVAQIQARVRAGTIRPDVATLAARVVDSFGDTPEAAALRASLPNLRRSAGLCPGCGRPHRGDPEICPRCAASRPSHASPSPGEPDP